MNRQPIEIGEWYHCYNRGVDKRKVFLGPGDYDRFLLLMYTANGHLPSHTFHLREKQLQRFLAEDKTKRDQIVEIGAYSLMPNHFHFVLKETRAGGIALFMQKVLTGYTMFFNKKNERTGALFAGTFKSKHIDDDDYLKLLIPYVHLNSVELFDPKWKSGRGSTAAVQQRVSQYPYSSLMDFIGKPRPERKIIGDAIFELYDSLPSAREMLDDAKEYFTQTNTEV
ncbi:MAG: transposase [Candidatus Kaiserbacteria bacterium]|nr:MAG: transposase [Candidatus Kaiserbacteria bacterium]